MNVSHIIAFCLSRPFEPFQVFISDGRCVEIGHPEAVTLADFAAEIWVFHKTRQVEVIDVEKITSLRTIEPVDPSNYIR